MPAMPQPACLYAVPLCCAAVLCCVCAAAHAAAAASHPRLPRLQALATGWLDIRQHPSTSAYCYLLSWRLVRGNRGDWHIGGGLADIGLLVAILPRMAFEDGSRSTIGMPPDSQYP